jgi:hypothetical protein
MMFGNSRADAAVFRRVARRVEDILQAAKERERNGQRLALEIDAKFQLQDMGAVQFQLASAILEEVGGMREEEVVSELLALGLAAVLEGAAKAADAVPIPEDLDEILANRTGVPFFEAGPVEWPAPRVIH